MSDSLSSALSTADGLAVTPEMRERIDALERYDLSFLTDNFNDNLIKQGRLFSNEQIWPILKHFGRADLEIARTLEREFKRFVALTIIEPGMVHAPSGPVDMYWHFFILHTHAYREFCEHVWGSFDAQPAHD